MSEPSKAVFLSYAREDAGAARRIADALRNAGLEVWFDENELRGGDAWDAKIRRQIDACSLFAPIISHHTQERSKGYFRLEWKLAVDQMHLLAAGVPFVAPVAIDGTRESDAIVPPEFLRVQWTRLPEALPTPQFVEQMRRLLGVGPVGPDPEHGGTRTSHPVNPAVAVQGPGTTKKSWLWPVIVGLVMVGLAAFLLLHKPAPAATAGTAEVKLTAPAATDSSSKAPAKEDKSIAVLPFENMSEDKDNAFFTDGIHEDILTNLALIHELRVVSRTSVMQYRDTKKPIRQIAAELGVTYVLEGSVQRAGNKVRVTGQLIHAATDEHIWAKAYDRDLTDIFAIQAELSQQIADALQAALSPEEKVRIARRPTENTVAYDLFLRSRDIGNREGPTPSSNERRTSLLQHAVELDPRFAQAWAELADVEAYGVFSFADGMDERLAKAKAAIDRALELAPEDTEVIRSLGTYYYYGYRDYAKASEQYERLARQQPNDPTVFNSLSLIQRRQGHWAQAVVNGRRAVELDPANTGYLRNLLHSLTHGNRWDEATEIQKRLVALLPDEVMERYYLVSMTFSAHGSVKETNEFFAHLSPEEANSPAGLDARRDWAMTVGDWAEAIRIDHLQPYFEGSVFRRAEQANLAAQAYYALGDRAGAIARLGDTPAELRRLLAIEPKNARNWSFLATAEVIQGHPAEAVRCAERSVELMSESLDALDGPIYAQVRALVYDWTGDKERALAEYARLLRRPGFVNIYALKYGFSTLHGDPRFEALINDAKNNEPMF
jgi:TolB-like protein/cytochrome c-type biogenesis protein CcmH/NrfG